MLSACVSGGGSLPVTSSPPAVNPAAITLSPSSLAFSGTGSAYSQTVMVNDSAVAPTYTIASTTCGTGAAAIVSAAPGTSVPYNGSVTVTPVTVTPVAAGTCTATISDNFGASATLAITVNNGAVTVSGRR